MTKWFEPNEMRYDFYQAQHPWGPWGFICSHSDNFIGGNGHMYGPSLCAKFQERHGAGVRMSLFAAGCPFQDRPSSLYKIWRIPIDLRTAPLPASTLVKHNDVRILYRGAWTAPAGTEFFRKNAAGDRTSSEGASALLAFFGTGIEYLAEKGPGLGVADVYVDGSLKHKINLALSDFPHLSRIAVFGVSALPNKRHMIEIVNRGGVAAVDGFRIYRA
ncbi:MAG: hypothetical protein ACRD4O_05555 [Bryobacteraceae bacterium]